jgi:serine phosphatase RsbU (regulator of sigma subunit)/HAMP domain-containing protein
MNNGSRSFFNQMLIRLLPLGIVPLGFCAYFFLSKLFNDAHRDAEIIFERLASGMRTTLDIEAEKAVIILREAGAETTNLGTFRQQAQDKIARNPFIKKLFLVDSDAAVLADSGGHYGKMDKEDTAAIINAIQQKLPTGMRSSLLLDEAGEPYFFILDKVDSKKYLVANVDLQAWLVQMRRQLVVYPEVLLALTSNVLGEAPLLINEEKKDQWARFATIRGLSNGEVLREASAFSAGGMVEGGEYFVYKKSLGINTQNIVMAIPSEIVYADAHAAVTGFFLALLAITGLIVGVSWIWSNQLSSPIDQLAAAVAAVGAEKSVAFNVNKSTAEIENLAKSLATMTEKLILERQSSTILSKLCVSVFGAQTIDDLMKTVVELACTQCGGSFAWFLPQSRHQETVKKPIPSLTAWLYRDHKIVKIDKTQIAELSSFNDDNQIFLFAVRRNNRDLGTLRVRFDAAVGAFNRDLTNSLSELIDLALLKYDAIEKNAVVAVELEMAETVQRSMLQNKPNISNLSKVAYHYQASGQLGGDWFYIIEDQRRNGLYVVMGEVKGAEFLQGLVATAVKGALDMLDQLIRSEVDLPPFSPMQIVHILDLVIRNTGGLCEDAQGCYVGKNSQPLKMNCLTAYLDFNRSNVRICNVGHNAPVVFRELGGISSVTHLRDFMGTNENSSSKKCIETTHELKPNDLLFVFSDGLSASGSLKSEVFEKFLLRALRQKRAYEEPNELRDEILQHYKYFTQGSKIKKDVCFVILQVPPFESKVSSDKNGPLCPTNQIF